MKHSDTTYLIINVFYNDGDLFSFSLHFVVYTKSDSSYMVKNFPEGRPIYMAYSGGYSRLRNATRCTSGSIHMLVYLKVSRLFSSTSLIASLVRKSLVCVCLIKEMLTFNFQVRGAKFKGGENEFINILELLWVTSC